MLDQALLQAITWSFLHRQAPKITCVIVDPIVLIFGELEAHQLRDM